METLTSVPPEAPPKSPSKPPQAPSKPPQSPASTPPLFVGGAALTKKFTATQIAPQYAGVTVYARDAMGGLELANRLFAPATRT